MSFRRQYSVYSGMALSLSLYIYIYRWIESGPQKHTGYEKQVPEK